MAPPTADVTMLLRAAASGEKTDVDALLVAIYGDLRRLAASHMQSEAGNHTLQSTAIVHEAYLRLVDQHNTTWQDRVHFFAVASRIIRRILVDHARGRAAQKRGGDRTRLRIDDQDLAGPASQVDLLALDEALQELASIHPQQAKVVELRYFGGCTISEIAGLLDVSTRTVDRDWQAARAWLAVRLGDDEDDHGGAARHGS